ncbi:neural-cadherin-like [Schistocerca serialis cubense]|uniref:neural-cadherin-like n=1 Tax=Schistocerca serialis cubense TaxID=2023355 RepID=UPI00214E9A6B|nr:neural-cadherin-like [Schistocerca serialis cubense]
MCSGMMVKTVNSYSTSLWDGSLFKGPVFFSLQNNSASLMTKFTMYSYHHYLSGSTSPTQSSSLPCNFYAPSSTPHIVWCSTYSTVFYMNVTTNDEWQTQPEGCWISAHHNTNDFESCAGPTHVIPLIVSSYVIIGKGQYWHSWSLIFHAFMRIMCGFIHNSVGQCHHKCLSYGFQTCMFQVNILAIDDGVPPKTSTATLTVIVKDVNDNAPHLLENYEAVLTENTSPKEIIEILGADSDDYSRNNGPPFTFKMDPIANEQIRSSFSVHFDQKGPNGHGSAIISSLRSFDREQQKEYLVPVLVIDSGYPPLTGTSTVKIIIGDINDNKMKFGRKNILVYKYKDQTPETDIGRIYIEDPDDWDLPDKKFFWNTHEHHRFRINEASGMITMKRNTPDGIYNLVFRVQDHKHKQNNVSAIVTVTVKHISHDAILNSGSLRISNLSDEDFIKEWNYMVIFMEESKAEQLKTVLSEVLNAQRESVDIFSVNGHRSFPPVLDIFFTVRDKRYHSSEKINGLLQTLSTLYQTYLRKSSSVCLIPSMQKCASGSFKNSNIKQYCRLNFITSFNSQVFHQSLASFKFSCELIVFSNEYRKLNSVMNKKFYNVNIERKTKLDLIMAGIHYCFIDKINCQDLCIDSYRIGSHPVLVDANTTSLAGISVVITAKCNPATQNFAGANTCNEKHCYNGGYCIKEKSSVSCACPSGYEGPRCQQTVRSFQGSGWAWFQSIQPQAENHVSVEFLTYKEDGLLFYNGPLSPVIIDGVTISDYIALELKSGEPRLLFHLGHDTTEIFIKVKKKLNDGMWHQIDLFWGSENVHLILDYCKSADVVELQDMKTSLFNGTSCLVKAKVSKFSERLNLNSPLQIGGIYWEEIPPEIYKWNASPNAIGFEGCIRNFYSNGQYKICDRIIFRHSHPIFQYTWSTVAKAFQYHQKNCLGCLWDAPTSLNTYLGESNGTSSEYFISSLASSTPLKTLISAQSLHEIIAVSPVFVVFGTSRFSTLIIVFFLSSKPTSTPEFNCLYLYSTILDLADTLLSAGTVADCLQTKLACSTINCSGHGVCQADFTERPPWCLCDAGWSGPSCSSPTQPVTFLPHSYIKFALSFEIGHFTTLMQLRFRTEEKDGELFRLADQQSLEYAVLEINNGNLYFRYNLNRMNIEEKYICLCYISVDDGYWHTAKVSRYGSLSILELDDGEFLRRNQTSLFEGHQWLVIDKQEGAHAGGKAEHTGINTLEIYADYRNGCLDDIRLDGRLLPLPPVANVTQWGQATVALNLEFGCSFPSDCNSIICTEPVKCNDKLRQHKCMCNDVHVLATKSKNCIGNNCLSTSCTSAGNCLHHHSEFHYDCLCTDGVTDINCKFNGGKKTGNLNTWALMALSSVVIFIIVLAVLFLLCKYYYRSHRRSQIKMDAQTSASQYADNRENEEHGVSFNMEQLMSHPHENEVTVSLELQSN